MATDIYKVDLAFGDDFEVKASGDHALVSGLENVKASLFRRLITTPGSVIHRPNYGVGIKHFQSALNSLHNQRILAGRIQEQFEQDERVEKVLGVSITNTNKEPELINVMVRVAVVGYGEQAFNFIPFGDTV